MASESLTDDGAVSSAEMNILPYIAAGAFGLTIISFFFEFLSATAPIIGTISVSGTDTDWFFIVIAFSLAGMATVLTGHEALGVPLGIGSGSVGIYLFFEMQSRIDQLYADLAGNMFADSVSASIGIGVYMLVFTGLAAAAFSGLAYISK